MNNSLISVLLFEDNPGDERLIKEFLGGDAEIEFSITTVEFLKDGLQFLSNKQPDVILLDLGLPDSQGLETLFSIIPLAVNIPIIVLTGLDDKDTAKKALQANAQDYLIKGDFNKDLLIRVINYSIERKQVEKQLREKEEHLRLALSAAKQGLFDINIKNGYSFVDNNYSTMLGLGATNFDDTGSSWFDLMHPEDRDLFRNLANDYVEGKINELRVEFRQRTVSGKWLWVLALGDIVNRDAEGHPVRLTGTLTDITESKIASLKIVELLEESNRRLQRIEIIQRIDSEISISNQFELTLSILLKQVQSQLQVDSAVILLFDESRNVFIHSSNIGFRSQVIANSTVKIDWKIADHPDGDVRSHTIHDKNIDPDFRAILTDEEIEHYYGVSLTAKGKLIGVLEVFFRSPTKPDEEWFMYFKTLAGLTAIAIENSQLIVGLQNANKDIIDAYDATIEGWSNALDLRDKETEGHSKRVTEMTIALASRMKLFDLDKSNIRRGALLHDIGKMGVPDSILLKPGFLTTEERLIMQKHPDYAYGLLKSITFLQSAIDIPHYHHEKWDGTGYPDGLKGDQIPLSARLFAVVDVFDALTSDRPYRKAWSKEAALDHINNESGKHFDPQIVLEFLDLINQLAI
jgi:PAS domain S-box-containing protein/putative nucleotidyltransferase with HDIG domain